MNKLKLKNFNYLTTFLGGQSFAWQRVGDEFWGVSGKIVIEIKIKNNNGILWQTYPQKDDEEFINNYFETHINHEEIFGELQNEANLKSAIEQLNFIPILCQVFNDTLISFIISQNNNIPKIRSSVFKLRLNYGEKIKVKNYDFYLFPDIEKFSEISLEKLRESGVGYRAEYLKNAAIEAIEKNWRNSNISPNHQDLLKVKGIGDKVADCIMVFALGERKLTPIDLWGKRIISDLYNIKLKNYQSMQTFFQGRFGDKTAYAGHYLFEYIRKNWKESQRVILRT